VVKLAAGLAGEIPLIDGTVPSVTSNVAADESDPVGPFRTRIEKVPGLLSVTGATIVVLVFVVNSSFDTTQAFVVAHDGPVTTTCAVAGSNPVPVIVSVTIPTVAVAGEMVAIVGAAAPDAPPPSGAGAGGGLGVGLELGVWEGTDNTVVAAGEPSAEVAGVGELGELAAHALIVTASTSTPRAPRGLSERSRIVIQC
jgi:hypothetical protein